MCWSDHTVNGVSIQNFDQLLPVNREGLCLYTRLTQHNIEALNHSFVCTFLKLVKVYCIHSRGRITISYVYIVTWSDLANRHILLYPAIYYLLLAILPMSPFCKSILFQLWRFIFAETDITPITLIIRGDEYFWSDIDFSLWNLVLVIIYLDSSDDWFS